MSHEKVKSIVIKNNQVLITSSCSNDTSPTRQWHCESLTEILENEGKRSLDIEILKTYEQAVFQSTPSVLNKWTKALKVLKDMKEYESYNWRISTYKEDCPIYQNRQGEGLLRLFEIALNTKTK